MTILNFEFPTDLETAIMDTEIVNQNITAWTYYKDAMEIEAQTRILNASIEQTILIETVQEAYFFINWRHRQRQLLTHH